MIKLIELILDKNKKEKKLDASFEFREETIYFLFLTTTI